MTAIDPTRRPSAWRVSIPAVASQALNSGTNLLTSVRLAQILSPAEFGRVSIALVLGFLLTGATRSWAVDPIARMFVKAGRANGGRIPPRFIGGIIKASLIVGVIEGAVCAAVDLSVPVTTVLVGLTISLTAHDAMRAALLLNHVSVPCLFSDTVWLLGQVAFLALAAAAGQTTAGATIAAAWFGASIALIPLVVRLRRIPKAPEVGVKTRVRVVWVTEQVLGVGLLPLTTVVLAVTSGYEGSAAFRAALLLMGPVTILIAGLRQPILGWLSRIPPDRARRSMRQVALLVAMAAAVFGLPVLLLPDGIGRALLGQLWVPARSVLPAIVLQRVAGSVSEVFVATNRAFGMPGHALASRAGLVTAVLLSALVLGSYGPRPAAWGIAIVSVCWLAIQDLIGVAKDGTGSDKRILSLSAEPRSVRTLP